MGCKFYFTDDRYTEVFSLPDRCELQRDTGIFQDKGRLPGNKSRWMPTAGKSNFGVGCKEIPLLFRYIFFWAEFINYNPGTVIKQQPGTCHAAARQADNKNFLAA